MSAELTAEQEETLAAVRASMLGEDIEKWDATDRMWCVRIPGNAIDLNAKYRRIPRPVGPVGPEEVWVAVYGGEFVESAYAKNEAGCLCDDTRRRLVRYVRKDIAESWRAKP